MARISKVTDPAKIVTDPELLRDLVRQGIDKDYVEFHEDYSTEHPGAKRYRDLKSGKRFMVVSGLPKVDDVGRKIDVGWLFVEGEYYSKANLLSARVNKRQVRVGFKRKVVTWNPQIFLNGVEQSCSKATLLGVDPDNENYHNNVLEWDYGICKRRLRIIEGAILGRWVFAENPSGEVRIKYNQSGDLKLSLGEFAISDDEEIIPQEVFNEAEYPLEIGDSLTVYSTASDGDVYHNTSEVYATCYDAATGTLARPSLTTLYWGNRYVDPYYIIHRVFLYFVTSALGAGVSISATTLSLHGSGASPQETDTDHPDCGIVEGVQGDPFDTDDYGDHLLKTTLGADSYYSMDSWTTDAYNDKALNATGMGWISKTGTTLFCLRAKGDIDNATPTGENLVACYSTNKGSGYQPKLVITYTLGITEKTSSDTGSGEEALLNRAYVLPEVGTGSEALSSRLLGAVEQGAGAETLLARLLASTESASGLDAGGLIFTSGDVGSGLDAILALKALLAGDDSGSGIDTAFLIKVLLSADSGLGTEAVVTLLARIVAGELMVGSDRLVVKVESAPKGGGMRLPPGGKTSISSRRVNL